MIRTTTATKRIGAAELCPRCDCPGRSPFGCDDCFTKEGSMANEGRTIHDNVSVRTVLVREPDEEEGGHRTVVMFRVHESPEPGQPGITRISNVVILSAGTNDPHPAPTPTMVLAVADYLRGRFDCVLW